MDDTGPWRTVGDPWGDGQIGWPIRMVAFLCTGGGVWMDPRMLTSIGLGMDIVGIVFLFTCGGIAGEWIDRGKQRLLIEADDVQVARDRRIALVGSVLGLGLAVVGFALQIVAQWL